MLKNDLLESIANPDDQLAAEAQSGDITAEETLIRKYSYIVTRKAKAFFMAGADADDVMQEGMIGLLRAVRQYDPAKSASFATFAEICVTSQIISAIRSADRIKNKALNTSVSLNVPESEGIPLEDTLRANKADTPEEMLLLKDVTYYILNNGDNVFSDFEMRVLNEAMKGYSYDQIAEKLGKTPKSIDNALQRAKKKINAYLKI
ncbi:MAG: sigma-70 family RNA polymerase sigma factor [Firmicutes bacterium]|nr:sigma-70 family RNA polymerase sigma factor [Bacillota bacterium]